MSISQYHVCFSSAIMLLLCNYRWLLHWL